MELPISFLTFFFQWLHKLLTLCASENAKLQSTVTIYNQQSALHSSHSQAQQFGSVKVIHILNKGGVYFIQPFHR